MINENKKTKRNKTRNENELTWLIADSSTFYLQLIIDFYNRNDSKIRKVQEKKTRLDFKIKSQNIVDCFVLFLLLLYVFVCVCRTRLKSSLCVQQQQGQQEENKHEPFLTYIICMKFAMMNSN